MRRVSCAVAGIFALLALQVHAQSSFVDRHFEGTGRACSGELVVHTKSISWRTPFSKCIGLPYETVEHSHEDGVSRSVYRFMRDVPRCRYRYLMLQHDERRGSDIGWDVTGYADKQSYLADKAGSWQLNGEGTLSCYLVPQGASGERRAK